MTPFEHLLKDDEIAGVFTFARNSFGNKASPISTEQVAQVRAEMKDKDFITWRICRRNTRLGKQVRAPRYGCLDLLVQQLDKRCGGWELIHALSTIHSTMAGLCGAPCG